MINMRRKALIESQKKSSRLPSGYRELKWLGVSGTQWILTNYTPAGLNPYRVETRCAAGNGLLWVFGCRKGSGSGGGSNTINLFARNYSDLHNYGYRLSNQGTTTAFGVCDGSWNNIVVQQQDSTTVNVIIDNNSYPVTIASRTETYPIAIFGVYYNSDRTAGGIASDGKIAYLRFYENGGNPVREYIPCERESDGELGMYELVTEGFLGNSGTGTFISGGYA